MGNSRTKPASNGCAFQWQTDADDNTGGRTYRAPLTTDAAGARRLAAFVASDRTTDGMILSDTRSGTATLLSAAGLSDSLDGDAAASVPISELTYEASSLPTIAENDGGRGGGGGGGAVASRGDVKNVRQADGGCTSSPNVLPLWCERSQQRSTVNTRDSHTIRIRSPVRMTTCVMAHRLTLAFDIALDMPPGNRRTHRVFNWTAIVRLSSCAAQVAVHMWPHAARRVLDDPRSQTDGWERAPKGVARRSMSTRFSACPPHHLVAELPGTSVAVLDIRDDIALSRLAAPAFSGWIEYESVEAAYAAVPPIGAALQHRLPSYVAAAAAAVPRTLDPRFPDRSYMSGIPGGHSNRHRVVAISMPADGRVGACLSAPPGNADTTAADEKSSVSIGAEGLVMALTHDDRRRQSTLTLFDQNSRRVREQRAFEVDRGFATRLPRAFPSGTGFRFESLHRLPHSGDTLGFVRPYHAVDARPSERSPTLWLQTYDGAFAHQATRAFHPHAESVRVRAVLPNDDVLCRVAFRLPHWFGDEEAEAGGTTLDSATLALRPSTGRCHIAFPNDTDCDPLVWLPPCPLVSGARRSRIAAALAAFSPRDLIDVVCAYDTAVVFR